MQALLASIILRNRSFSETNLSGLEGIEGLIGVADERQTHLGFL